MVARLRLLETHMEKIVLLLLIVATIGALAELAPAGRRHE